MGPDQSLNVGDPCLRTFALPHFMPHLGVRVETDESTIADIGASGPTETVTNLARGADRVIGKATHRELPQEEGPRFLLTATEAGRFACEAQAKRLMVAYSWPEDGRRVSCDLAPAQFAEDPVLAEDGMALPLE